jgi:uncharacterized protein
MNPEICALDSELFYEGKLHPVKGSENQRISRADQPTPSIIYLPTIHTGNRNSSAEEAEEIARLVGSLTSGSWSWRDRDGDHTAISLSDILIITPYNAQVAQISELIPGARVGTVDKFQGQEAPVAIYSMATSNKEDAPRGMEFLFSANRLNVALSRAKAMAILVSNPSLFDLTCSTPEQIQLANAFCRYLEVSEGMEL